MIDIYYTIKVISRWIKVIVLWTTMYFWDLYCTLFIKRDSPKYNFIKLYISVLKESRTVNGNPSYLVNYLVKYSEHVLKRLKDHKKETLITDFKTQIGGSLYAGSMTNNELELFQILASKDKLNTKYVRYAYNILWALIGKVISPLIFEGCVINTSHWTDEEVPIYLIRANIDNGMDYMIRVLGMDGVNKQLLKAIIEDGLYAIDTSQHYEKRCNGKKVMNCNDMYYHVMKMMYIGSRPIQMKDRDITTTGYNEEYMNWVSVLSAYILSDNEKKLAVTNNRIYPWGCRNIYNVSQKSDYNASCKQRNIYVGSGRSGSSFELLIMLIILFPDLCKDTDKMKKTLMLFINFHVLTGTHSVFECVLSFIDVMDYIDNVSDDMQIQNECCNTLRKIFKESFVSKDHFQINKTTVVKDMLTESITFEDSVIFDLKTFRSLYVKTKLD